MHTTPDLTIVVPTVNRPELFARALASALRQANDCSLQVMVSLNGAGPETEDQLQPYLHDPRLRVFRHAALLSPTAHFNFLLDHIEGPYCVFLSDDDWLEPDFAESALSFLHDFPELAFLVCGCRMHFEKVSAPARLGPPVQDGATFLSEWISGSRHVCFCATVFPTGKLRQIGPLPDQTIFGDMYYWVRLACTGAVGSLDKPLAHYTALLSTHRSESSMSDMREWGAQTKSLLNIAVTHLQQAPHHDSQVLERQAADYLARTIAWQFLLKACTGVSKQQLLKQARWTLDYLPGGRLRNWCALGMALTLPRPLVLKSFLFVLKQHTRK
jgi:hypothetical protein